jgi:hypothetical protein
VFALAYSHRPMPRSRVALNVLTLVASAANQKTAFRQSPISV